MSKSDIKKDKRERKRVLDTKKGEITQAKEKRRLIIDNLRILRMQYKKLEKDIIIPKMKMVKGVVRKTIIGDDGKRYEIEEVIELPVFEEEKK